MSQENDGPHVYLVYDNRTVTARIEHNGQISSYKKVFRDYENLDPHDFCEKVANEIESFMGTSITWSMIERNGLTGEEAERMAEIRKQARKNEARAQSIRDAKKKAQIKADMTLKSSGLDLDHITDGDIRIRNAREIERVYTKLMGSGLHSLGGLLMGGERSDAAFQLEATKALIEQNWILIRQNEQILRELKKLNEQGNSE